MPWPDRLPGVEEEAASLRHVPGTLVTFYLIEPFLPNLGEGNLVQERT